MDANTGFSDVFVHDRQRGETTRVSVASDGTQANSSSADPSLSANGRYVAFHSWASNLVVGDTNGKADVFVYSRMDDVSNMHRRALIPIIDLLLK